MQMYMIVLLFCCILDYISIFLHNWLTIQYTVGLRRKKTQTTSHLLLKFKMLSNVTLNSQILICNVNARLVKRIECSMQSWTKLANCLASGYTVSTDAEHKKYVHIIDKDNMFYDYSFHVPLSISLEYLRKLFMNLNCCHSIQY